MSTMPSYIQYSNDIDPNDERIHIIPPPRQRGQAAVYCPKLNVRRGIAARFYKLLRLLRECRDADQGNGGGGFRTIEQLMDLLRINEPETIKRYFSDISVALKGTDIVAEEDIYEKREEPGYLGYRLRENVVIA